MRRPNILIVHCHDLGQFLGCYGVETVQTPNLDAFAEEGVRFARSFCTAPQCSPSRAALFTGRYPHTNGMMGLCHADFGWDLHPGERHLGQLLAGAGYATAGVGVIHETRGGAFRCGLKEYRPESHAAEAAAAADALLGELARHPERPFYLQVGFNEPHRTKGPGEEDYMGFLGGRLQPDTERGVQVPGFLRDTPGTRAELAELQGAIRYVDECFGRVLHSLRRHALEPNTLVLFTTDHGPALPRAKCALYDPGIAVALMLRYPSRTGWSGGRTPQPMISNIDVLPTLLEAAGVPVPQNVQGRSFAPLLDGGAYSPRDAVFAEITHHDYYDPRRAIRTERHKLIANFSSAYAFMDPSQSWRPRCDTVVPPDHAVAYHPPVELYDLQEDRWELRDRADDPAGADVKRHLMARLYQHLVETEDPILEGAVTPPLHRRTAALLAEAARGAGLASTGP